jgi:large subunit ribosomal protein L19
VWSKIEDKGKTRLQAFEGLVLARKHGAEAGATFTVRKVSNTVGVERIFPLYSPNIDKIEVVKRANVRRSKLYYVREKAAKEISKKMKMYTLKGIQEEEVAEEAAAAE